MMRNASPVLTKPPLLPLKCVASDSGLTSHPPHVPQHGPACTARGGPKTPLIPVDRSGDKGLVHFGEQAPCLFNGQFPSQHREGIRLVRRRSAHAPGDRLPGIHLLAICQIRVPLQQHRPSLARRQPLTHRFPIAGVPREIPVLEFHPRQRTIVNKPDGNLARPTGVRVDGPIRLNPPGKNDALRRIEGQHLTPDQFGPVMTPLQAPSSDCRLQSDILQVISGEGVVGRPPVSELLNEHSKGDIRGNINDLGVTNDIFLFRQLGSLSFRFDRIAVPVMLIAQPVNWPVK